ncbi:MAG: hypothetical protein V8S30_03530 [Merdibacter sp.]
MNKCVMMLGVGLMVGAYLGYSNGDEIEEMAHIMHTDNSAPQTVDKTPCVLKNTGDFLFQICVFDCLLAYFFPK